MSYLWTPLTPGYYDLTADCSLALVALLLQGLVELPTPRAWTPCVTGVIGVALVVTKWTAFPVLVLTVGLAIWCRIHVSWRECVRYAIYLLLGATVALMTCQLFLVPLGRFVTIMWKVSSLTTVGSHGFVYLATHNLSSTASLTFSALVIGLPLVIGLFAARAAAQREHDVRARIWLIGAATMTSIILPFTVGWHGGAEHGSALVGAALAGLLVAVLAAVVPRPGPMPGGGTGSLLVVLMFLVPFLQAAGTNVPLLYVAAECLVLWAAIVLMMVTRAGVPRVTTFAVLVDLSVLVVATAMIAGTTTLMAPFKTTSFHADTHQVPRLGVRVSASTARQYDVLQSALAPYIDRGTTPVITLDQMAGLTYLLGGVPAGSTWTDAVSPTRTAGILESRLSQPRRSGRTRSRADCRPADRHTAGTCHGSVRLRLSAGLSPPRRPARSAGSTGVRATRLLMRLRVGRWPFPVAATAIRFRMVWPLGTWRCASSSPRRTPRRRSSSAEAPGRRVSREGTASDAIVRRCRLGRSDVAGASPGGWPSSRSRASSAGRSRRS